MGGPQVCALSRDDLLSARFDYACPLVGVEVEDGLPSAERALQGLGTCRGLFGHDLACGVSGVRTWVELRRYCPHWRYVTLLHTPGVLHVTTALDRTRATH